MRTLLLILFSLGYLGSSFAQNNGQSKSSLMSGYIGTALPAASFVDGEFTSNFNSSTSIVFPIGLNLKKSDKFSFSFELDPLLSLTRDSSLISNLAILPGVLLHQKNVTYGIRAGFETNGRYGLSFSLLKSLIKRENFNIILGIPLDLRTGNKAPHSIDTGLIVVVII